MKTCNIATLFLCFFCNIDCTVYSQSVDEYAIKAVWLGKFTHFIDWPQEIKDNSQNFCIGIYKSDPFAGAMEKLYSGYTIWGKPVKIKHINSIDSVQTVNLLFLPKNTNINLEKLTSISKARSILLVSETKGFAESGTHINFLVTGDKVRFEINESAMHDSGFFVSFRLLNIATIVKPILTE